MAQPRVVTLVRLADLGTVGTADLPALVQAVAFSDDSSQLGVGTAAGALHLFDVASFPALRRRFDAHPEQTVAALGLPGVIDERIPHVSLSAVRGVTAISFVPSHGRIATAGFGFLRLWDLTTGARVGEIPLTRPSTTGEQVATVAASMDLSEVDGRTEIVVAERSRAWRVDPDTATTVGVVDTPQSQNLSALTDAERKVLVADRAIFADYQLGEIQQLDVDAPGTRLLLNTALDDNRGLAIHPSGTQLAVSSRDGIALVSLTGSGIISRGVPLDRAKGGDLFITDDGTFLSQLNLATSRTSVWRVGEGSSASTEIEIAGLRDRSDHDWRFADHGSPRPAGNGGIVLGDARCRERRARVRRALHHDQLVSAPGLRRRLHAPLAWIAGDPHLRVLHAHRPKDCAAEPSRPRRIRHCGGRRQPAPDGADRHGVRDEGVAVRRARDHLRGPGHRTGGPTRAEGRGPWLPCRSVAEDRAGGLVLGGSVPLVVGLYAVSLVQLGASARTPRITVDVVALADPRVLLPELRVPPAPLVVEIGPYVSELDPRLAEPAGRARLAEELVLALTVETEAFRRRDPRLLASVAHGAG